MKEIYIYIYFFHLYLYTSNIYLRYTSDCVCRVGSLARPCHPTFVCLLRTTTARTRARGRGPSARGGRPLVRRDARLPRPPRLPRRRGGAPHQALRPRCRRLRNPRDEIDARRLFDRPLPRHAHAHRKGWGGGFGMTRGTYADHYVASPLRCNFKVF